MTETIEMMLRHRSVRKYRPDPLPQDHIRAAVSSGQMASTSSAIQAYCLLQVTAESERQQLVGFTGGQKYVGECGAFFVVCGDMRRLQLVAKRAGNPHHTRLEGFLLATVDASLFAQNLALAFESLGYGICYIGGLRNNLPAIDKLLQLPQGIYPLFGLCAGVPGEASDSSEADRPGTASADAAPDTPFSGAPGAKPRLPVDAVLFEDRYPSDGEMLGMIDEYDAVYLRYLEGRGAEPRAWSEINAAAFVEPKRVEIADYYRAKGADLS